MAIYEYFCQNHETFEVQQKITDDPLKFCPHCKEEGKGDVEVKKLISLGSFHLSGGGWASNGYS